MQLSIRNIGKIKDSQIDLNGLTVIAGENNTGKSTFGKALYCMFNAFCNADMAVRDERNRHITDVFSHTFRSPVLRQKFPKLRKLPQEITAMLEESKPLDAVCALIKDSFSAIPADELNLADNAVSSIMNEIKQVWSIDEDTILGTLINRIFNYEFHGQINHVNNSNGAGEVALVIKKKRVSVAITRNECVDFYRGIDILHNAIFIDTPFVMDDVSDLLDEFPRFAPRKPIRGLRHSRYLTYLLVDGHNDQTVMEDALIRSKRNSVLGKLRAIVDGEFNEDQESLAFVEKGLETPVALSNVSTGIKAVLVLKRLLEAGKIREQDVLVFDEPEVHLHPEWQVKFAEILVVLQKEYDLTILLTTHSPFFLNALDTYSRQYGIEDRCAYYMAQAQGNTAAVRDVTGSIDEIYQQLAAPFEKLDAIDYPGEL